MKKLHLFILKSYLGPFIATFLISMFVLIMQFLWRDIDDFVGKGLEIWVILKLLWYISITLIPLALPLAVLLSSIMTFGSLGEHYELIALKSAGISLYRIMLPLIIFISGITIFAFFFSNNILPYANLKGISLLYDIRQHKPELVFKDGIFTNELDGYSIKIDNIDKNTGVMYGVSIYNHKSVNGNYEVTKADSGLMNINTVENNLDLELYSGYTYTDEGLDYKNRTTFPFRRVKFGKQNITIAMPGNDLKRTDEDLFKGNSIMLNLTQLSHTIDSVRNLLSERNKYIKNSILQSEIRKKRIWESKKDSLLIAMTPPSDMSIKELMLGLDIDEKLKSTESALRYAREVKNKFEEDKNYNKRQNDYIRKSDVEWNKKFTLSFACLIFFFIGAPLGAIIRKGGLGMPFVVSILLFIVYWVISMIGERSAKEGAIMPFIGTWISSIILLPLGIILTYKSVTDSEIMNIEAYSNFFKKILNFFKKKRK